MKTFDHLSLLKEIRHHALMANIKYTRFCELTATGSSNVCLTSNSVDRALEELLPTEDEVHQMTLIVSDAESLSTDLKRNLTLLISFIQKQRGKEKIETLKSNISCRLVQYGLDYCSCSICSGVQSQVQDIIGKCIEQIKKEK